MLSNKLTQLRLGVCLGVFRDRDVRERYAIKLSERLQRGVVGDNERHLDRQVACVLAAQQLFERVRGL